MSVVSLSAFGLVSVRCLELRGVCFLEVRNAFYGKINQGQVICPLYRGCPLFGLSVIRCFTVYCREAVSGKYSKLCWNFERKMTMANVGISYSTVAKVLVLLVLVQLLNCTHFSLSFS